MTPNMKPQSICLLFIVLTCAIEPVKAQQPTRAGGLSQVAKLFSATNVKVEPDNTLILTYSFRSERELSDFECTSGSVKLGASYLAIEAGYLIKHKALFKNVARVECKMAQKNWKSDFISTTAGQKLHSYSYNAWLIHLTSPFGEHKGTQSKFDNDYTKSGDAFRYFPIFFALDEQRAIAKFGKFEGKEIVLALVGNNTPIGAFSFYGGSGGSRLKELVIAGKLDPSWLLEQRELTGKD